MFKWQLSIDRHSPRLIPNNCNSDPPHFSLLSTLLLIFLLSLRSAILTDSINFYYGKSNIGAYVVSSPPGVHGPRAEDVGGGRGGAPTRRLPFQHQRAAQRRRLRTGERRDRQGSLLYFNFFTFTVC
jgi:hypothetical protein